MEDRRAYGLPYWGENGGGRRQAAYDNGGKEGKVPRDSFGGKGCRRHSTFHVYPLVPRVTLLSIFFLLPAGSASVRPFPPLIFVARRRMTSDGLPSLKLKTFRFLSRFFSLRNKSPTVAHPAQLNLLHNGIQYPF
jgi:hypothetical protein